MLQFITDGRDVETTVQQALEALNGGCRWIQIRMKEASDADVIEAASRICPYAHEQGSILLLDDRVHLVKRTGADGVHLGKTDMNPEEARKYLGDNAIIGVTVNNLEDILALRHEIIDYMGMGPYRFTTTKKKLAAILGVNGYKDILGEARRRGISTPVVAIGGIAIDDVQKLVEAGVDGVAVSGAICRADDPVEVTRQFVKLLNQNIKKCKTN